MADDQLQRLMEAPIPVLSNRTILKMMDANRIRISGFDPEKLAPTAYRISPRTLRFRNDDEDGLGPDEHVFSVKTQSKLLRPGEYAIVSPDEQIDVDEGFTVDFYPSSWCVDKRLVLTSGRLDAHYRGDLVFGLFNAGRIDVELTVKSQIARASFSWLGAENMPIYKGPAPGAYNKQYQELRERQQRIDVEAAALSRRKAEIVKALAELQGKTT